MRLPFVSACFTVLLLCCLLLCPALSAYANTGMPDLRGNWSATCNGHQLSLDIASQQDAVFSGTSTNSRIVDGKIAGATITFTRVIGAIRQVYSGTLTVAADGTATITGTFTQDGGGLYQWSAVKREKMKLIGTTAQPNPVNANPIQKFVWLGKIADKVGPNAMTKADTAPDLCFQAVLSFPTPTVIDSISVFLCTEQGTGLGEYWVSRGYGQLWILGVFTNGELVNTRPDITLGTHSGPVLFNLYATDSGRIPPNSYFRLDVTIAGKTHTTIIKADAPSPALTAADIMPKPDTTPKPDITPKPDTTPKPPTPPDGTTPASALRVSMMTPPLLTVRHEIGDARVAGPESMKAVVERTTIQAVTAAELPDALRAAHAAAIASGQVRLAQRVYRVSAGGQDGWLGGTVVIELPIPAEMEAQATSTNAGALCLTPDGAIFVRGVLVRKRGVVQVATNHFSTWCFGLFGGKSELDQFIADEAARRVGMRKAGFDQRIIDLSARYLESLDGISDESRAKIMKQLLASRDDINNIATSAGADDTAKLAKSCGDLIGKLIIDNLDETTLATVLKGVVGNLDLLKVTVNELNAAQQEETYDVAISNIAEHFLRNQPVAKAAQLAADTVSLGCEALQETIWQDAYTTYRDGTKRILIVGGGQVEAGDWETIKERYSRPMVHYLRQKQPSLTEDEALTMAKKMMDARKAQEEAISKEEESLRTLHETFVNYSQRAELKQRTGLTDEMAQFRDFTQRVRRIEVDLAAYGIDGPVFGARGLRSDAMRLMHGFALNGEAGYRKALQEIRATVSRKLRLPGGEEINLAKLAWNVEDWHDAAKMQPRTRVATTTGLRITEKFFSTGVLERRYIDTRRGDPIEIIYWYYANGCLRSCSQRHANKGPFGTTTTFHENGMLKRETVYATYQRPLAERSYYDNGARQNEITWDANGNSTDKYYLLDGRLRLTRYTDKDHRTREVMHIADEDL